MKKAIIILVWIGMAAFVGNAQEANFGKSLRLGYTYFGGAAAPGYVPPTDGSVYLVCGNGLSLDADLFRVAGNLTAGAYLGVGEAQTASGTAGSTNIVTSPAVGMRYGVSLRYHLLPASDKWDVTLGGTLGAYCSKHLPPQKEYGLSASATYYPLPHLGVFGEAGWGSYLFGSKDTPAMVGGTTMLKAGISYRF